MSLIEESWRGERPLRIVFWGYGLGFYFVYLFALFFLVSILPEKFSSLVLIAGILFLFPYIIWIMVSIWRCARNTKPKWRSLARGWVIFSVAGLIVNVLVSYPHYRDYMYRQSLNEKIVALRSAGFSEQEIQEWIHQETARLKDSDASLKKQQ